MNPIEIDCNETVCGTTISLSFAISPEALMHEVQAESVIGVNSHSLFEVPEELIQAIRQEARSLLDQSRLKMQICLISSYMKLLKDDNGEKLIPKTHNDKGE